MLKPYKFQQTIIDRAKAFDNFALFMDTGTGKTLTAINIVRDKYKNHGRVLRTLILCPIIVMPNWKREFLLSTFIDEKHIGVASHKTPKGRAKTILSHRIVIVNYDAIRTAAVFTALAKFDPEVIICDESHRIKSRTSKTFKAICRVATTTKNKYILTGTPITNSFEDAWAQYMFLDRGATWGNNFFAFKNRYFINNNAKWQATGAKNTFPDWCLNKSRLPEINEKIASTSARIKKEDCLDLPQLVVQHFDVPLSAEQQKHYKNIKDDLITWLDSQADNPLVVKNALTRVLRLNEISSGFMRLADKEIVEFKENPRLTRCMELVEDLMPHKVIIFCVFKRNYMHIRDMLKKKRIKYVELHGEISSEQKFKNIDEFNNGDASVMIANTRSGGLGVNLQSARYSIYYTRNFNLDDFLQSQARNYRAGSKDLHDKITHYHLVSKGTIDEKIYQALKNKERMAEKIIDVRKLLT